MGTHGPVGETDCNQTLTLMTVQWEELEARGRLCDSRLRLRGGSVGKRSAPRPGEEQRLTRPGLCACGGDHGEVRE